MFVITLIEPEIPPNTGNIARLAAATRCRLELVGKLGFSIDDKAVRRAGLDYWPLVDLVHYPNLDAYLDGLKPEQLHLLSTKADQAYWQRRFQPGDHLVFGAETKGLSAAIRQRFAPQCCRIPMWEPGVRSLNLSNSVGIVLYEALRQNQELNPTPQQDHVP